MNLKERISDLKLLVKNDRRIWAGVAFFAAAMVIFMFTHTGPQRPKIRPGYKPSKNVGRPSSAATEAYADLIVAFKNDLESNQRRIIEQESVLYRLKQDFEENSERSAGVMENIVDKMEEMIRSIDKLEQGGVTTQVNVEGIPGQETLGTTEPELEKFGLQKATVPPPPPEPPRPTKMTFISPGDTVCIQLLTGVNAPVDGTPYPVLFRLSCPITGPDGSTLDLGEARIIAAAQGSEVDSRVIFRLTDLSIRHQDGRRSVVPIDGWVIGEDGIRGMQGKLIDNLGQVMAATAGVSFAAELADRIDGKNNGIGIQGGQAGVTVNADDINVATAGAVTDASNRLGAIFLDRLEQQVPVVEILSGREVVAVFSKPTEVNLCGEECDGEDIYYSSLD